MAGYKVGIERGQIMLCSFEDMVAPDAMVRVIDRFIEVVDLEKLGFAKLQPAETGCPAYPPKAMCKLYVYGYENGVRSSRKLEREALRNVEVMWLMGGLTPDDWTISNFRKNNIRALQKLFREFVKLCKSWDLVGGELIAFDGSKFKASNNKKMNFSRKKINDRLTRLDEQIKNYLAEIEAADERDNAEKATDTTGLQKLLERKELYEEYKKQLDESGENEVSAVDPDARLMGNNRGGVEVAYNVQSAVDGKHNIILEYDVSMNPADHGQLGSMVKKVKRKLKLKRFTALADKGYYNGSDLLRVKRNKVTAIVSKQKPAKPKDRPVEFDLDKFTYNAETDAYTCPMGYELRTTNKNKSKRRDYHNKAVCTECPKKAECAGKGKFRRVMRSEYADIYEETDRRFDENKELYRLRQQIVEPPFGTVKHNMNGRYFLLRTRRKVCAEVALLFLGYNLKRAVKILGFEEIMKRLDSLYRSFYELLLEPLSFGKFTAVTDCF